LKSKLDDAEILKLHSQGLLHKEIASILGCSTCTITQHLNKLGVRTYKTDKELVRKMHLAGMQDVEIADALGCTRSNITVCLNKMGYSNRRSKVQNIDLRNRISQSLIGRFVGEKNPNYKGYTDEKEIARGIFKTISKRLIRNRGFSCEHCGKHGGDLQTHHIKPFSVIMAEFFNTKYDGEIENLYDELMSYPDFTDESNMVVLCRDCHHKVHYTDNPELSPYRWESATTIESAS
jgi:5-methylcytosine-specific restriction endonuclease McrA